MSEVGALIVRLQAETAEFRADMGKVKQDLNDLKGVAGDTGDGMDYSMTKARGGIMLLENATGVRMPRALNSLIASIPAVGLAFSTMLPIIGVVAAIAVISKLIDKHNEAKTSAENLKTAHVNAGTVAANAFMGLEDKLLQVGIKSDELSGNHLGALKKQLELIDHQSLRELSTEFDRFAKSAEDVFARLKTNMFEFGSGSEGAKHSLQEFKNQYQSLLDAKDDKGADNLLNEKIKREEKILALQKQGVELSKHDTTGYSDAGVKLAAVMVQLKEYSVGMTDKEVESEQALVDVLHNQAKAHELNQKVTGGEKTNAIAIETNKTLAQSAALEHSVAQGALAHAAAEKELAVTLAQANEAEANAGNKGEKADPMARAQASIDAAGKEYDAEIAFAEKTLSIKQDEYEADLKEAGSNTDKKKLIEQKWVNEQQAWADQVERAQEKAYRKGVQAVAAAIDEKIEIQKRLDEETKKAAQEQNSFETKMAQISFEKDKQAAQMKLAAHKGSYVAYLKAEQDAENTRYKLEQEANKKELALIKGAGPKEAAERVAINHKIEEQAAQHANNLVKITDDEEKRKLRLIQQAEEKMGEAIAKTAAHSLVEGKNMGQAFEQVGKQMLETALTNLLQMETVQGRKKMGDAKTAAADAYASAGNPILGAIEAAVAFSAVMAFANGGTVPGSGYADTVPAMLMPGETVVSKALTEQVKNNTTNSSSSNGDTHTHLHYSPHISAIDSDGVEGMLKKHATTFSKHVNDHLRKQNKRLS